MRNKEYARAMVPKMLMNMSFGAYARINPNMKAPKTRKAPYTAVDLRREHEPLSYFLWTKTNRMSRNHPAKTAADLANGGLAWNTGLDLMLECSIREVRGRFDGSVYLA
jgi:hypothetical protein